MWKPTRNLSKRSSIFFPQRTEQHAYRVGIPIVNHAQEYIHDAHRRAENSARFLRQNIQEIRRRRLEKKREYLHFQGVSPESLTRLQHGAEPRTPAQQRLVDQLDAPHQPGYALTSSSSLLKETNSVDPGAFIVNPSYRYKILEERRSIRLLNTQLRRIPRRPSAIFARIMRNRMQQQENHEKLARRSRNRMEEETGITAEQRLDAYMLGDTRIFPLWVREDIPPIYRDRVLYGGLGITEYDEVTRQRLMRLPPQERAQEWARLKAQRELADSIERMISPRELKEIITCRRQRYHWLLRRRMEYMYQKSVIAQRYPKASLHGEWDTNRIDYSARLSLVAKAVRCVSLPEGAQEGSGDNSVASGTAGEWPLSEEKIMERFERIEAEQEVGDIVGKALSGEVDGVDVDEAFVTTHHAPAATACNPHILRTLRTYHTSFFASPLQTRRPIPWLSRREYQHRWAAVYHGYRDEYGKRRVEAVRPWKDNRAIQSYEEWAQRSETLGEPKPWLSKEYRRYAQLWCAKYKTEYRTLKQDLPRH